MADTAHLRIWWNEVSEVELELKSQGRMLASKGKRILSAGGERLGDAADRLKFSAYDPKVLLGILFAVSVLFALFGSAGEQRPPQSGYYSV